jgi:outer membrane protein assembly factor BamA
VKFNSHTGRRSACDSRQASVFLTCVVVILSLAADANSQSAPSTQQLRLEKIEVVGLHRYTKEQVIEASGLQIGQVVNGDLLDAAAGRMAGSGLFKKLSYRLKGAAGNAVVTFEIEELTGGDPVVFDNFVWFGEDELAAAIKRDLPSFDGTATAAGEVTSLIAKALQRLLDERKIAGKVEYTPSADPSGRNAKHVYSVKDVPIPICSMRFPGAADVEESELVKSSKPLFGTEYSREFVASFAEKNLKPIYRERGHLRVAFQAPTAKPESLASCKDGAEVSVLVEEGVAYSWEKAEWNGNNALSSEELINALGMKAGELANGLKIDKGIDSVREAYGQKGYLMPRTVAQPCFDDTTRRVTYTVALSEGPQFHMGDLVIVGFSEADARGLRDKWKLKKGDVYDATYLKAFLKAVIPGVMTRLGPGAGRIHTDMKPDRQNLTVDVTISLKK